MNAISKRRNLGLMHFGPWFQSLGSSWWERRGSSSDPGGQAEVVHIVEDLEIKIKAGTRGSV